MELNEARVVVTGGGNGIGAAMARRFHAEGAELIVVADVDRASAEAVAEEIGGVAVTADLSTEEGNHEVLEAALEYGPIDLLCCNAGIAVNGGADAPDEGWQRSWDINVMAHVWATRFVLPSMLERGEGYILTTASAAGLLGMIGSAPYSVTKHAAVAYAEWLSITHGAAGIGVSCLCPQGVRTNMLFPEGANEDDPSLARVRMHRVLEPEDVAEAVVQGLREERFLILPHPEVQDYVEAKATDHEGWLAGMRRMQARLHS
jgi:NAD(P)-dependent dehydrogenase (short-subunit alcohol dehydrogenase family)